MSGQRSERFGFRYLEVMLRGRPRHDRYDPFSVRHPSMDPSRRAKIFAPFDALRGFSAALIAKEAQVQYAEDGAGSEPEDIALKKTSRRDIMCTRFYIDISDKELQEIVAAASGSALADRFVRAGSPLRSSGEIRPTDVTAAIATSRSGRRMIYPMQWGFRLPGQTRDTMLFNARCETASQKKTFRESWKSHRCILPSSWYFEWEHLRDPSSGRAKPGQKYAIQTRASAITWLCGLYRIEDGLPRFVVLTRDPSEEIAFIHDRMPVIMPPHLIDRWIDPKADADEVIGSALTDVVFEKAF